MNISAASLDAICRTRDGYVRWFKSVTSIDLLDYEPHVASECLQVGVWFSRRRGAIPVQEIINDSMEYITQERTGFFRDGFVWESLSRFVSARPATTWTAWCAACSFGCEPYSLAMLLNSATKRNKHYIIATDIDSRLLRHAKRGAFQHHDLLDDPLGLIPRYTVWREGHCVVADTIRTTVSFRNHNALLGSPIREPVDILLMRNLLTYLSPNAQARAMQASYDALKPGGAFVVSSPDIEINKGFTLLEPSVYIRL